MGDGKLLVTHQSKYFSASIFVRLLTTECGLQQLYF
jgi:hypothetical protein